MQPGEMIQKTVAIQEKSFYNMTDINVKGH
jgi:hypothetical protein